ncbi:MAG: hypothetical protein U0136_19655 [Bdellovibrionota bacterium]
MFRSARLLLLTTLLLPASAWADFGHSGRHHDRDDDCDRGYHSSNYSSGWNHSPQWNGWYGSHGNYRPQPQYDGYFSNVIRSGYRSGELSPREVRELRESEQDLERKRAAYLRDGWLSNREREDLRDDYKDLRKELNHELHDGEHRW